MTGSEPFNGFGGTVYDVYIKQRLIAQVVGRLAWGLDARVMHAHMRDAVRAAARASVALDVPCGGGLELRWLEPGDDVRFVAVDGAAHMVERARRYAARRGLRQVEAKVADVARLPLSDGEAAVTLLYNGIHHFGEPARAIAEVARCTEPGGELFGCTFIFGEHARCDRFLRATQRRGRLGPAGTRADVMGWLTDAGFEIVDTMTSGGMLLFTGRRAVP